MANKSINIGSNITIRQFLNDNLNESTGLKITIPGDTTSTQVYDVNVIWDGGEYYISYTTNSESEAKADTIRRLDEVMPLFLTTIETEAVLEDF